jgi:mono/diheme cytochrome c family protein
MVIIVSLANIQIVSGQAGKEQTLPIPENINKIFQTSCMPCHGSNGGMMSLAKLNFSKWAEYGAAKEAEKASRICSVLTKEAMPPKSARKSKPELIPTKEQIELICKWAESLKSKEEKK